MPGRESQRRHCSKIAFQFGTQSAELFPVCFNTYATKSYSKSKIRCHNAPRLFHVKTATAKGVSFIVVPVS